jgi:enamine deaminase RidA (YjgF/YER057c/UK114 family)
MPATSKSRRFGELEKLEIQSWRNCGYLENQYVYYIHFETSSQRHIQSSPIKHRKHSIPANFSKSHRKPVLKKPQDVFSHLHQRARSRTETQRSRPLLARLSGQGGWDNDGNLDQYDWKQQIKNAFENVDRVLRAAGFRGWEDVSVVEYLVRL